MNSFSGGGRRQHFQAMVYKVAYLEVSGIFEVNAMYACVGEVAGRQHHPTERHECLPVVCTQLLDAVGASYW